MTKTLTKIRPDEVRIGDTVSGLPGVAGIEVTAIEQHRRTRQFTIRFADGSREFYGCQTSFIYRTDAR